MENLLSSKYLDVEVTGTIKYSEELKKVTFSADLQHIDYHPGSSIIFRASDRELRHYTPYNFAEAAGTFEVMFHLHGKGPGSDLASRLLPGDRLKISAPGGKKLYEPKADYHYFFGDETSLSFYFALMEEIHTNGQLCRGVLELNESNLNIPEDLGFDVKTVSRSPENPASTAIAVLQADLAAIPGLLRQAVFYLTGNVASVQAFRKVLRSLGVASKSIKLQGYWAEGSVGL
ncbi:siderophore-interacting protein [Mucilaginibacter sp. 21P]|uniref:siderophore-interacting protein n=1 Tax=Mucilaginibacter sp. 21P TaxID=2778902 RepID=UPI001C584204|nr:siderophore-interacting protein [Mucilaginibacter sp. 21P]QXV63957.1 siderophore-interacting protein [Mucilaginibacter sp. 21P]